MFDVIIIGAGLSGALTALNLAKHFKVLLIESGDSVIPAISSSYNECYKLHTGVHYVGDLLTAKHCLEKSIQFARKFPEYILGGDDLLSPWRRGRHYFMSNSLVSTDRAVEVAIQLQERYRDLVSLDHRNKVFGEPQDFIYLLSQEDYPHMAKDIPFYNKHGHEESVSIVLGIETAESQIDINRLKTDLQQKVLNNRNITFLCSTTVFKISSNNSKFGYLVSTKESTGEINEYESKAIVNCAWQNIELLDRGAGVYVPDENRVIRVKISILVQLPESLRRMNTFICSSGPYCSVTTLPNGTAILTSERTTNVGFFKAGIVDDEILGFIKNELKLHTVKGNSIANNILRECASYLIPSLCGDLIQSPILELHVGFVKIMQNQKQYTIASLYEEDSVIHARQQDGIEVLDLAYISNSGMKMTFTVGNAEIVSTLIEEQLAVVEEVIILAGLIIKIIEPLYLSIENHLRHINSIIYNNYREVLKHAVLSVEYSSDKMSCAKIMADEIIKSLEKKNNILRNLLTSPRFFTEQFEVKKLDTVYYFSELK